MSTGKLERAQWGSKAGFILAAAGSAVGLGNLWKFPYITGENGGGAFVLIYLGCIVVVGLPTMIAEVLLEQAKAHPDRQELLERFLERAEPRVRFAHDEITTTGLRLLRKLGENVDVQAEAAK